MGQRSDNFKRRAKMYTSVAKPFRAAIRAVLPTLAAMAMTLCVASTAHATLILFTLSPTASTPLVNLSGNGTDATIGIPSGFSGNTTPVAAGIDPGTFTFSTVTLTAGPNNGAGIYPINMTTGTFNYTGTDGDIINGNVTWSYAKDGSNLPDLIGTITVTSSTGDETFALGTLLGFDMVLAMNAGSTTFDQLVSNSLSTTANLSSGEVTATPEPGSFALMVIGLGLIGFALRQRSVLGDPSAA
jgi:hypothetical protein